MWHFLVPLGIIVPFMLTGNVLSIDCIKDCRNPDYTNPDYKPQECNDECSEELEKLKEEELEGGTIIDLEAQINKLLTLVIALTVLVAAMLIVLVIFIAKNSKLSSTLLKSWRKTQHHTNVKITTDKNAARIANYSTQQHSPRSFRHLKHASEANGRQVPYSSTPTDHIPRPRKPSESTCPDESEAVDVAAYDNLALSTSTLSGHSRPSSPASQSTSSPLSHPSPSIATLNTTMTTIQMDSLPQRNDVSRRTTP